MGLVGSPQVLFLDEPTTGLDPRSRRALWDIIRELVADRCHGPAHHPVPGGGRPARRPHRGARPAAASSPTGTADELKRLVPGGHVRLAFPDTAGLRRPPACSPASVRDEAALALQVPSGGTPTRSATCSTAGPPRHRGRPAVRAHPRPRRRVPRPHRAPDARGGDLPMTTALAAPTAAPIRSGDHALRDCATMLRRQLRRIQRYPSMTLMLVGMPVIFLLLFVYVLGGTLGAGLGGGDRGDYATYVTPGILLMTVGARRQRHRGVDGDGHDRGHRRPVPHDGDLPAVRAHRPRAGQPGPDDAVGRRGRRRRGPGGLPPDRRTSAGGSPRSG